MTNAGRVVDIGQRGSWREIKQWAESEKTEALRASPCKGLVCLQSSSVTCPSNLPLSSPHIYVADICVMEGHYFI